MSKRRKLILGILSVTGVLLLFVGYRAATQGESKNKTQQAKSSYILVKRAPFEGKLSWRGVVRAANRIEIRADRHIKVGKVRVSNSESVKKGQLLIEIDKTETETKRNDLLDRKKTSSLQFQASQAKFEHAQKVFARKKELLARGIVPQREFDDAVKEYRMSDNEIKVKQLEAEKNDRDLAQLDQQLKLSNYYAPEDGTISSLIASDVPELNTGQTIAVLSDLKSLVLWVLVEEGNLSKLSVGQPATVVLDVAPGISLDGKIKEIASATPVQDGSLKTYEVEIAFESKALKLREGYSGQATISLFKKEAALTVPMVAIRYVEGKSFALVAQQEKGPYSPRPVELGLKTEDEAEITSGVSEKEYVVVESN